MLVSGHPSLEGLALVLTKGGCIRSRKGPWNDPNILKPQDNEAARPSCSSSSSSSYSSSSVIRNLYIAQFLVRWDARMWEFSVGLYMISLWPNSLILVAVYGAVESASTVTFGPIIRQWVEQLTYVQVLWLWLVVQNLSFVVAGGSVVTLLHFPTLKSTNFTSFISLVVSTNASGAIGTLSTLAGSILVEKECGDFRMPSSKCANRDELDHQTDRSGMQAARTSRFWVHHQLLVT